MKKSTKYLHTTLLGLSLSALSANATTLVSADFDAGYTAGATVNGQSGSGDVGLSGSWAIPVLDPSIDNDLQIVSGGLDYQVSGGGLIDGGSQALRYNQQSGDVSTNTLVSRSLSTTVDQSEFFLRFVIQQDQASAAGDFLFWWLTTSGDFTSHADNPSMGIYNDDLAAQINSSGKAGSGVASGSPQLLVAKFTKDGVSNQYETVDFWIDPAYGDSVTPQATATDASGNLSAGTFIGIQVNNMTGGTQYLMDSYAIGTTWDSVVPIPEPSSYAIFTTILICIATISIRRRKE